MQEATIKTDQQACGWMGPLRQSRRNVEVLLFPVIALWLYTEKERGKTKR